MREPLWPPNPGLAQASAPGVSRRDALRALTAGGLWASTSGLLLPAGEAAAATPRRGGRIRVAGMSSSISDTLDPAKGALSTDYVRHFMLYSGLTYFDSTLTSQLGLAQEISHSKATLWTIKLRPGVVFHDGKPLSAADVVYSLLRHKNPATSSKVKAIAAQFEEIKVTGPLELQIRLSGPNADLPSILATSHFVVIKEGVTDFRTAIGTGPYRCKEFNPGVHTLGVRNENYWKPGRPYIDEIELLGIPDETARVNALLAGDVHMAIAVNPRSTPRIAATPGYVAKQTVSGLYTNLIMRQDMSPTGNPDFVLALKYLLDREQIRNAVFRGFATLGNDQPIPPSNRYHFAGLPQRPYDPERARFHLKKAGLIGASLPVYATPAAEASVEMATLLQRSAASVGLNLEVKRMPADGYWSTHWMKHALGFGNINPRPTADLIFSQFFKSDAPWNESGWKNEKFDQLLVAARAETDEAKRKQLYGDMQVLVHEKCGIGLPVFINIIDAYDDRIKGYGSIPIGGLMGYSFADYVWYEP